jgi:putative PIN family toxin of toxin-antitoxin system
LRVYLDTNVLISAHTTRGLSADLYRLILAEHELLTGEVNLTEIRRVLREKFRVPAPLRRRVEQDLREHTVIPKPGAPSPVALRDPDDAWVLASAAAGNADVLVTGDKDLLEAAPRSPVAIVTPRACWEALRRAR